MPSEKMQENEKPRNLESRENFHNGQIVLEQQYGERDSSPSARLAQNRVRCIAHDLHFSAAPTLLVAGQMVPRRRLDYCKGEQQLRCWWGFPTRFPS